MRAPLIYRLVINPLRAYFERDDRLLVPHFKDTFKPETKKKVIRAWPRVSHGVSTDRIYRVAGRR